MIKPIKSADINNLSDAFNVSELLVAFIDNTDNALKDPSQETQFRVFSMRADLARALIDQITEDKDETQRLIDVAFDLRRGMVPVQ